MSVRVEIPRRIELSPHRVSGRGHARHLRGGTEMGKRTCITDSCDEPVHARGMCKVHYSRALRRGTTIGVEDRLPFHKDVVSRFFAKRPQGNPDQCWLWQGNRSTSGEYGVLYEHGRRVRAHRLAWSIANGLPVPDGLEVRHTCDNPPCCNPAHLILGTHAENMADMAERRRAHKTGHVGEKHGMAKLTDAAVVEIRRRAANGERQSALAREFEVTRTTVSYVVLRKSWTHL